MPTLATTVALLAAVLSAAALYAGSRHCRWAAWRRLGRAGNWLGLALAIVSLALWARVLGPGAGLCAMLGTWMLAMMAWPYLAGLRVAADARGSDG